MNRKILRILALVFLLLSSVFSSVGAANPVPLNSARDGLSDEDWRQIQALLPIPEQQAYTKPSNPGSGDYFGYSIDLFGDTVVVGAYRESSSATGVNGDDTDNSATDSGAVYVFVRSGSTWIQQAYLKASNTDAYDYFGYSVAIDQDTIVVGATGEGSNATGIDGDQTDNSASDAGAVYVFTRVGSVWSQQAYLKASNTEASDTFGVDVAISGDTIVVGADYEDSNASGIDGDQTDNSASYAGAVYVFTRVGSVWSQQAYLKASNTEAYDAFGAGVAISGNTIVVGADSEDSNASGINGDQSNNTLNSSGAAYVFTRVGTVWSQQAYLKASNPDWGDNFGFRTSISVDTIVIGAPGEMSNATGINGDQTNNSITNAGAVYVFTRSGSVWSQQAYIKASNPGLNDFFGGRIDIFGETIVVGVWMEDSNATGINGDQTNNTATNSGAAYEFTRVGTTWSQLAYIKASNSQASDEFGSSIAIYGDEIVVGAIGEDSNATGSNGDQTNNTVFDSGAFYAFGVQPSSTSSSVKITGISPKQGPITGGTELTLTGKNFLPKSVYRIGGYKMNCVYFSSTKVVCYTPAHKIGKNVISISNDNGTDRYYAFEYINGLIIPATGFQPNGVTTLPAQPALKQYANTSLRLVIPSLQVNADIVGVPASEKSWDVTWLGNNVGYLAGSAFPTWLGNSVLTGHVWNANNTPGIFANLKDLRYGDRFVIEAFGSAYTYEVRENMELKSWDGNTLMKHYEDNSWISLVTCEDYSESSKTYTNRRLVRAVLVSAD